ncbi:metal-dependent hydrolase [Halobacterium wangiae]|uniref:metal-dependent hydrolase n=1 Tax=Halobacterium wangiae TaxID=2902623 RepID=UPI001E4C3A05|nr:metal-dependent hydrolase [Halobacterium wangiae]
MHRSGHYGVALLSYAPVLYVLAAQGHVVAGVTGGALVLALTLLPDVDLSIPLMAHRGVTHTVAFAAFVGAAVWAAVWFAPVAVASRELVAAGAGGLAAFAVLAHLLADALTPRGVPLLWPLTGRRFSLDAGPSDSVLWNAGLLAVGAFATVAAVATAAGVY